MYIQSYVSIRGSSISADGKTLSFNDTPSQKDLLRSAYQLLAPDYPKFFKMDELCKLAFISAELLLKNFSREQFSENEISIVLSNASSTIETDRKHQESIQEDQNYFPSPAVFVYTLPNITIGEIAIRHKIKGENTFFVTQQYNIPFMCRYVSSLLENNRAKKVLSGWMEYNSDRCYDGFLYLAGQEKAGLSIAHTAENIDKLYKSGHPV